MNDEKQINLKNNSITLVNNDKAMSETVENMLEQWNFNNKGIQLIIYLFSKL